MSRGAFIICEPDKEAPAGAVEEELSSLGCTAKVVRSSKKLPASSHPEESSGVIVMGGGTQSADARNAYGSEKECLDRALARGKPVLGICLGAQLLALRCGGDFTRQSRLTDKGWKSVTLTKAGRTDPVLKVL